MHSRPPSETSIAVRAAIAFVVLFVLYQSAEGVGQRWLHSVSVQDALMVACVVAAWPLSHWLGYRGYGAWALNAPPRGMAWLAGGLVVAFAAKAGALWLGHRHGIYTPTTAATVVPLAAWLATVPMLLVSTFVPSLAEDILTRGFWYRAARIRWRFGVAFVGTSALIYVLNHIYRLDQGPTQWLMLFCFGLAYATALWRSGTLWAAVGLHWGWNLANGVLDHFMPWTVVDAHGNDLLSATVHLIIVALLLVLPPTGGRTTRHSQPLPPGREFPSSERTSGSQ